MNPIVLFFIPLVMIPATFLGVTLLVALLDRSPHPVAAPIARLPYRDSQAPEPGSLADRAARR